MVRSTGCSRIRGLAGALALGAGIAASFGPMINGNLVLCVPVEARADGHALVRPLGEGRFFAPIRQAMFFSHPGGRCAWHPSGPAKA